MPVTKSNFDIEGILGKSLGDIDEVIQNKNRHVKKIQIPKHDGTKRTIIAPDKDLKYLQKAIYWKLLMRYRPSKAAHGFVRGRSIRTNAMPHVGAQSMGKIDIKSFFDTIGVKHLQNCIFGNKNICRMCKHHERMMNGLCHPSLYQNKFKNFEYKCEEMKAMFIPEYCKETGYESLFTRVIELCTIGGFTAQGFPTSPMLANIVMRGYDEKMINYCDQKNIVYTRYADDMAFSSKEMGKQDLKGAIQKKVYHLLWAFGFKPNIKKTTWKSRAGCMKICGVVVNVKTSVKRNVVMLFRAKVHHATVKKREATKKSLIRSLKGWASYLMSIDHDKGVKYMTQLTNFEKQMATE
jgi:retron-type reverse transcriptase